MNDCRLIKLEIIRVNAEKNDLFNLSFNSINSIKYAEFNVTPKKQNLA